MEQTLLAKMIVILCGCLGVTVLMLTHTVDGGAGLPILTAFVGYVTGNGVLTMKQRQYDRQESPSA